jgi:hypothetical protein
MSRFTGLMKQLPPLAGAFRFSFSSPSMYGKQA